MAEDCATGLDAIQAFAFGTLRLIIIGIARGNQRKTGILAALAPCSVTSATYPTTPSRHATVASTLDKSLYAL